jgi:hypothetical protein
LGGREGEERKKRNQDDERRRGHDGEIQVLIVTRLEIQREREREKLVPFLFEWVWFGLLDMVVVEVIVEWALNGSLGSHGMQERNRERR